MTEAKEPKKVKKNPAKAIDSLVAEIKENREDSKQKQLIEKADMKFFVDTAKELAIPFKFLEFKCIRDGLPGVGSYMCPTKDGDIRFYTPSIDGEMECYTTDTTNVKVHDWYLTRFQTPNKDKNGRLAKYMPVQGGGTRLQMTPLVTEAYKAKKKIKTLYMIEGFKKSLSVWFHGGLPVVGMNGLYGFKEPQKNQIRAELRDLLKVCEVERVVILNDSDLFNIAESKEYAESSRPMDFFRAAIAAKSLLEPFCDVCLVHPVPGEKKLGFDDLLLEKSTYKFTNEDLLSDTKIEDSGRAYIFERLASILKNGTDSDGVFSMCKLSAISDFRIKEYFHLDDVQNFYTYHITELKARRTFRFGTYKYKVREDGTLEEVKDVENFGYKIVDGCIMKPGGRDAKGEPKADTLIANFTMKILFHIKGDENVRVVELVNNLNQRIVLEVSSEDLSSPQKFFSLCVNEGEFIFYGGKDDLIKILGNILKHERQAIVFSNLGYQPGSGVFAFSNGIATVDGWKPCDEYGIVEHNDNFFYFPAYSKFNARKLDRFADDRKYCHIESDKKYTFEQWQAQFCKVYKENGVVTVCFYLATLFSDIVFNHRSGIGFPLLFASGKPKTGKSTIFISLLRLFGDGLNGESLTSSSTFKFLFTQFAKMRNGLVFLDEYSNDNPKVFDFLKNIFDRRPYGTKQYSNDNKTRIVPVLCPCCVAGEVLPTGNHALFTRSISLMFNIVEDVRTEAEKDEFRKLSRMEETGLTSITVNMVKNRHFVENHFDKTYSEVSKTVDFQFRKMVIDGRMKKSAKWILTVVKVLLDNEAIFFDGYSFDDIVSIWTNALIAQNNQIQTNTDAAKFWEIIESLIRDGLISEDAGDYSFQGNYFVIRLNRVVQKYQKRAIELHFSKVLDKPSLANYLSTESYFVDTANADGSPRLIRFSGSSSPTSGIWLDYATLAERYGIDLTKQVFAKIINSGPVDQGSTEPEPEERTPDAEQMKMKLNN
jgi:hypothetical protein